MTVLESKNIELVQTLFAVKILLASKDSKNYIIEL